MCKASDRTQEEPRKLEAGSAENNFLQSIN